jgi:tetratricopeptide (TPR) repeat protein
MIYGCNSVLKTRLISLLCLLGAACVLSGCATTVPQLGQDAFNAALEQSGLKVDALLSTGNQEEAIGVLESLSKSNPARKEPWVRKAKIYFDAENYGQAIVSADEALQRDTTDRTAKSIRAVSGLRVATQSLADLRTDVELKGSARTDAISLAKVLRETLGEDVLVPPAEIEARRRREAAARAHALQLQNQRAAAKPAARAPASPPPAAASSSGSGGDPFSVLK